MTFTKAQGKYFATQPCVNSRDNKRDDRTILLSQPFLSRLETLRGVAGSGETRIGDGHYRAA
jgi:hypothetical protein